MVYTLKMYNNAYNKNNGGDVYVMLHINVEVE